MGIEGIGGLLGGVDIGWRDVLDIAIVTFVIYEFLKLIRHTQAIQVVFAARWWSGSTMFRKSHRSGPSTG